MIAQSLILLCLRASSLPCILPMHVPQEQIKILELKRSEGQLATLIDWGESFYSEAKVTDLDRIFVCIGSGVFMDFTLQEARQVADKWLHLLERKKDIFVGQLAHEVAQHQSA